MNATETRTETHEYVFDARLWAEIRVKAATESEARAKLQEQMKGWEVSIGQGPDLMMTEVSIDDYAPDLFEVDGERVD